MIAVSPTALHDINRVLLSAGSYKKRCDSDKKQTFSHFENFVFNELLKQQYDEITFANSKGECDFVVKKGFEYQAIQVCYELTPENNKREFGGFNAIEKEVKLDKKTIITYNQERQEKDIEVVPVWKFFFENNS